MNNFKINYLVIDCDKQLSILNTTDLHKSSNYEAGIITIAGSLYYNSYVPVEAKTGDNISIVSHSEVILNPGFTAEAGSNVEISIDPCPEAGIVTEPRICVKSSMNGLVDKDSLNSEINTQNIDNSIQVYPNPNKGIFNVSVASTDRYSLQVFNSAGVLIHKQKSSSNHFAEIDIKNSPTGFYFVKVITDTETTIRKIIKE